MTIQSKLTVLIAVLVFAAASVFAGTKEIKVQTNLHCGSCASKIEKGLKKTDGVINSKANVETKVVTIRYDESVTDATKLTKRISDLGYNAELVKKTDDKCSTECKSSKTAGKDCCDTKATKSAPKK